MSQVLLVTSSPRGAASHSTRIAQSLADKLVAGDPDAEIITRDLSKETLPHIGEDFVAGLFAPSDRLTAAQSAAIALSDRLIAEWFAADVIVLASSMINFGVSSTLKTYIDYLVRKGVTFSYTEKGPEGLVKGKKAFIVQASGGIYSEGPMKAIDFQEPYLKHILGFIGITDVEIIHIEGVAMGAEATEKALTAAAAKVSAIRPRAKAA
jgi:FMN-dependent NADH-azoreductase